MTTITDDVTNGCTFCWKIENISHCWLENGESIASPSFIADVLAGTKWYLKLYPKGGAFGNDVGFYLSKHIDCLGTDAIEVNYQLAFLDKDGSFLKEETAMNWSFTKGQSWGYPSFEPRVKVFINERAAFLPEDTLTVQCTIWKQSETLCKSEYSYARTVFKVNRESFVWKIEGFSTLKTDMRCKFKDDLIDLALDLNKVHITNELDVDIISFHTSIKFFSFKTSIMNSDGENCRVHEYITGDLKTGLLSMPVFSKEMIENMALFLPNDVLSLHFDYVSSNGTASHEFCSRGKIYRNATKVVVEKSSVHCMEEEKPQVLPFLGKDLKFLYNDGIFSDTELRTATRTFPAHKIILSARSPVFRKMFCNETEEMNRGPIDVTDLESDTIHRMLLYIYTDTLEDMQFENACKLYSAAYKYQILSLKIRCSSFIKDNLSLAKFCDALALADLHQDDDLKSAVQDYILKHDKEVFGSQEWKLFMATNIHLAADIMYWKLSQVRI